VTGEQLLEQMAEIERQIGLLDTERKPLGKRLGEIDSEKAKLKKQAGDVKAKLSIKKRPASISDHAVLRFLERKYAFDFEKIRKQLLSPKVKSAMEAGASGVKIEGGTLKIRNKTVTTFIASGGAS